jgi:hypothetical protein
LNEPLELFICGMSLFIFPTIVREIRSALRNLAPADILLEIHRSTAPPPTGPAI